MCCIIPSFGIYLYCQTEIMKTKTNQNQDQKPRTHTQITQHSKTKTMKNLFNFKTKTMKNLILTFLLIAGFTFGLSAGTTDVASNTQISYEKIVDLQIPESEMTENNVFVQYLLDSEGHPYLVSVYSDDPVLSGMVEVMVGELNLKLEDALMITFDYDQIK